MVMIAALAMLMLVFAALFITRSSRQVTARYGYFVGLYDLAVAGNEQALFLLWQGVEANRELINERANERTSENGLTYKSIFIEEAMPFAIASLRTYFTVVGLQYQRNWGVKINFDMPEGHTLEDNYQATTTVSITDYGFLVATRISKYIGTTQGFPVVVEAGIVWVNTDCTCIILPNITTGDSSNNILINCLDYYTLAMVELLRVAD